MNISRIRPYLGDSALYRAISKIAIPIMAQSLITVGINLMDTVMLSSMGDAQLSASTLAGQFINLFHICCMGIGMGANVLTSRYWGMKDLPSLRRAVTLMLRLVFVFSGAFTLAAVLSPEGIMRVYSKDQDIIAYGAVYIRWLTLTYFCQGFSLTCTIVLRSVGQVRVPLYCSIVAFALNVFFNWVFIFGNLGAPRMEIGGAALGTLIARVFELACICGYFFFVDTRIAYRLRCLRMKCASLLREYFTVSIPVLVSDALLALGNNAVAVIMGHIGKTFVAANSVTTVVQQLCSIFTMGISNASGIITGHTMGQGDYAKAQRQGYTFLWLGFVFGLVAAGLIFVLRAPIVNYYDVSPETRAIAMRLMDAISLVIVFQTMNSILTKGVLRAGGDTRFLMIGDALFLWVASVPLGALAGLVFKWPAFWVYLFLKIDQVLKCFWCVWRLRSGKWLKTIRGEAQINQTRKT